MLLSVCVVMVGLEFYHTRAAEENKLFVRSMLSSIWDETTEQWVDENKALATDALLNEQLYSAILEEDYQSALQILSTDFNYVAKAYNIGDWQILDKSGRVSLSLRQPNVHPQGEPLLINEKPLATQTQTTVITTKDHLLSIVVPVYTRYGQVAAWMKLDADTVYLLTEYSRIADVCSVLETPDGGHFKAGCEGYQLDVGKPPAPEGSTENADFLHNMTLSFTTPQGAKISVAHSMPALDQEHRALLSRIVIFSGSAIVLMVLLWLYFLQWQLRPISALSRTIARAQSQGDLGVEVMVPPGTELRDMAESYNALVRRVRTDITALKDAEEQTQLQAKRLETATHAASVGIWEYEFDGQRMSFNQTIHDIFGLDHVDADAGDPLDRWYDTAHPDDLNEIQSCMDHAIHHRLGFNLRFRVIQPTTRAARHITTVATVIHDLKGRPERLIGVCWDITDSVNASEQIARREEEIRGILDAIPAFVYYKDADNTILRLNRAAAESIGRPIEEIENHKTEEFFPADDSAKYLEHDREVISGRKPKLGIIESYDTGNGDPRTTRTDKIPIANEQGEYDRLVAIASDITDQVRNELRLKESEERYKLAVRGSRDGLWDWDLVNDRVYYAPQWKSMLGLGPDDEISNRPDEWISRIDERDLGAFMQEFNEHLSGEDHVFEVELRMKHADGHTVWMLCRGAVIRNDTGKAIRVAGSLADITEIKGVQDKLRHIAQHDNLTDLPNRELFHTRLAEAIAQSAQDPNHKFAVLFFDFDRFKVINDSLGHDVGDALLTNIADRLRNNLRMSDTASRFGGDEFVVLLNGLKRYSEAHVIGNRFLSDFSKPHMLKGHEVISTASIGLVTNEAEYDCPEAMLRDADAAMYQAKEAGRARIVAFDQAMHDAAVDRLQMEADLREALERDEFHLVYQPIVSLEAGELHGFEALLRWEHPTRGFVSPAKFIPVAEDTGLIVPIGEWVLRKACQQLRQWNTVDRPELPVTINVNLSMKQVCHPGIIEIIRNAIYDSRVDPQYLKLEVTESTIVDDRNDMIPMLNQIKQLGISLAMDDFGTGHSSLGNLHMLPIDVLKIDQSFIKSMSANRDLAAVMHAIITLAHELGMQTVAEGIETAEQLVMLQSLDCNFGQGYYFQKPMRTEQATRYLLGLDDSAASA